MLFGRAAPAARAGARVVDAYLATAAVRACPGDAGADSEVALGSMATQEWVGMQHETAYEQNRRSPTEIRIFAHKTECYC